jgi:hypothetical protein
MPIDNFPNAQAFWSTWVEFLHRSGLENLAVWALEATDPLSVLGAQALYLSSPLIRPAFSNGHLEALAGLLEDRSEAQAFIAFMREEMSS